MSTLKKTCYYWCGDNRGTAQKTGNFRLQNQLMMTQTAGECKKLSRDLQPVPDEQRIELMKTALEMKFAQHPDLQRKLAMTGAATLIEGLGGSQVS